VFRKLGSILAKVLFRRQQDILSAAAILAAATFASAALGLFRDRALASFFSSGEIAVYFAAFRIPDTLFEILILGSLSAAFIPTFVKYISRGKGSEAWNVASAIMTLTFTAFLLLAIVVFFVARPLSRLLAPGFAPSEINLMASMTRILLIAQGFFILAFFLTGILKSFQHFLVPAIAPLFYNIGIIVGTIFLAGRLGIYAPAWGAVFGAFFYFSIHLPIARKLGFKFSPAFDFSHPGVRKVIALAVPRTIEIAFAQILKASDLFFSSLVSVGSYGYLTLASHLAAVPVSLVGNSLADASLPSLSYKRGNIGQFRETLLSVFRQIIFFVALPAVALIVLRVPAVRLSFGASRFTWESTVLTGYALSCLALGIVAQAAASLMVRAFYALADTLTPVRVGVCSILANILLSAVFILLLKTSVWGVAFAFALSNIFQVIVLVLLLCRRISFSVWEFVVPTFRIGLASFVSGGSMYILLKIFDRSAWDKRLSFLGYLTLPERFECFVLDTRYTINLVILTIAVATAGTVIYLLVAKLLGVNEVSLIGALWRRLPRLAKTAPPRQARGGEAELT